MKKSFGAQILVKGTKIRLKILFGLNDSKSGPKVGFLLLFQVYLISFPGNWIG